MCKRISECASGHLVDSVIECTVIRTFASACVGQNYHTAVPIDINLKAWML